MKAPATTSRMPAAARADTGAANTAAPSSDEKTGVSDSIGNVTDSGESWKARK
ncbi:hypothetical protein D3C83_336270 [compost metagenome]